MLGRSLAIAFAVLLSAAPPGAADDTAGPPARIDGQSSRIEDFGADLRIELTLTRPVPWRVYTLDGPWRLVLEFDGLDLRDAGLASIVASDGVSGLSAVPDESGGWQRIVLSLAVPLRIETAGLTESGTGAVLKLQLAPTTESEFSRSAGLDTAESRDGPRNRLLFTRSALVPGP